MNERDLLSILWLICTGVFLYLGLIDGKPTFNRLARVEGRWRITRFKFEDPAS